MIRKQSQQSSTDNPLVPLTLAVGQEDLLLDRAVQQVVAAARAADADTDVRDLTSDQLQPGTLAELTSPSLFAERKVVVVRNAQDLSADTIKDVKNYLGAPAEEITLVLLHAGGVKGKGCWTPPARPAHARLPARRRPSLPSGSPSFGRSSGPWAVPRPPRRARRWSTPSAAICGSSRAPPRSSSLTSRGRSTRRSSGATTQGARRPPASRSPTGPSRGARRTRWRRCAGRCRPGSLPY